MVTSSEISGSMSVVVAGEPSESGVAHKGEQNDRQDALKGQIVFTNINFYIIFLDQITGSDSDK